MVNIYAAIRATSILALSLFIGSAVAAGPVSDLDDLHASMSALEAHLLDESRAAQTALSTPDAYLVRHPDGSIVALTRNTIRDTAGHAFDWAQHFDIHNQLADYLPPDVVAVLNNGAGRMVSRIRAADMAEDSFSRNQPDIRAELINRLGEIDRLLDDVRTIAAAAIAERDALIAGTSQEGVIDLGPCNDPSISVDGEAQVAAIGYGGANYPVKGAFICLDPHRFLWDSGGTIREYRCSSERDCTLFSEMTYESTTRDDTGNTVYWLEDKRTHITFWFK